METRKQDEKKQERIACADLETVCVLPVKNILDFKITEKPGEHAGGVFHVRLGPEGKKDRIDMSKPFLLWKKGRGEQKKKEPLFAGYPSDIRIDCAGGCLEARITVKSGTLLLDEEKRNRAFQAPGQGILTVADSSYYFPRFYIGMPAGEKRELTQVGADLPFS